MCVCVGQVLLLPNVPSRILQLKSPTLWTLSECEKRLGKQTIFAKCRKVCEGWLLELEIKIILSLAQYKNLIEKQTILCVNMCLCEHISEFSKVLTEEECVWCYICIFICKYVVMNVCIWLSVLTGVCVFVSHSCHNIGHLFHLIDSGDSCAWGPALSMSVRLCVSYVSCLIRMCSNWPYTPLKIVQGRPAEECTHVCVSGRTLVWGQAEFSLLQQC